MFLHALNEEKGAPDLRELEKKKNKGNWGQKSGVSPDRQENAGNRKKTSRQN